MEWCVEKGWASGGEWMRALRFENAIHGGGELMPFLFAEAEFGQTLAGDREIAACPSAFL